MGKKILLIDDDRYVLRSVENLLKREGYDVTSVDNSSEAIEIAKNDFFDLIIVDIRMPELNGIETIKRIKDYQHKQEGPKSEFMVITGYADDDAPKESALLGISNFVLKPFDSEVFLETVKNCLEGRKEELLTFKLKKRELKEKIISVKERCFIYEKNVMLKDTNLMGNTYFANYILWQGEAREFCLLSHPRFQEEMDKIKHIKMITHSLYHRFVQESTFGDVIQIKITTREIKSCSFVIVFRYYNKKTGSFLGEGWQRVAFVDQRTGNFVPIPELIQELVYSVCEDENK